MKRFLVIGLLLLSVGIAKAQIVDIQHKGQFLRVYGSGNKELSYLQIDNSDEFLGMSSSFYVVKRGMFFKTYNHNSKEIGYLQVSNTDKFKNASGNTFNVKKGQFIFTYDLNCKLVSQRQE